MSHNYSEIKLDNYTNKTCHLYYLLCTNQALQKLNIFIHISNKLQRIDLLQLHHDNTKEKLLVDFTETYPDFNKRFVDELFLLISNNR